MRRFAILSLLAIIILVVLYLIGPQPPKYDLDGEIHPLQIALSDLESFIETKESAVTLKPDNHARIIWADSIPKKTEYSLVYLHGFSASQEEGDPIHEEFARRYGMNLYLSRLARHGLASENPFEILDPQKLLASAKEAVAIGNILGEKTIIMSCSTGGTLALFIAANNPEAIDGLICFSPNIAVYDPRASLLTKPWGKQIAKFSLGGEYYKTEGNEEEGKYWYLEYRYEGLIAMQQLLDATMNKGTFCAIQDPIFVGYYYKNEEEQDDVISVDAILKLQSQLCLDQNQQQFVAFEEAKAHVVNSRIKSEQLDDVRNATFRFAEEILLLQPKP